MTEIIVLRRKGRRRKQPENVILSLSFADFLVGTTFIASVIFRTSFDSNGTIQASLTSIFAFSIVVSVVHILLIAVDRIYSVLRPLRYRVILTRKRTYIVIATVWIFSIVLTTFMALLPCIIKRKDHPGLFQGIAISLTGGIVLIVYGYLGLYLVKKHAVRVSPTQNNCRNLSFNKKTRDTMFYTLLLSHLSFVLFQQQPAGCYQDEWI